MNKKSQKQKIIEYLMEGYSLSTLEAVHIINSVKLTSRISELRANGWDIQSVKVKDGNVTYNRYYMEVKNVSNDNDNTV